MILEAEEIFIRVDSNGELRNVLYYAHGKMCWLLHLGNTIVFSDRISYGSEPLPESEITSISYEDEPESFEYLIRVSL